jgi:Flp pilus assembly protein TadB
MNLGLGVALLIASIAAYWGWNNYLDEREAFNTFKGVQTALAEQQEIKNARETRKHDEAIKTALAERDSARQRLLDAQRARAKRMPSLPISPEGTTVVCFNRSGFESSIRTFVGGVQDLVIEGDESIIDNRAWLSSWPK